MRRTQATRTSGRDDAHDGDSWRALALVTVRTPEGVLFGRLEARDHDASLRRERGNYWK